MMTQEDNCYCYIACRYQEGVKFNIQHMIKYRFAYPLIERANKQENWLELYEFTKLILTAKSQI